jgi:hypothetical protein
MQRNTADIKGESREKLALVIDQLVNDAGHLQPDIHIVGPTGDVHGINIGILAHARETVFGRGSGHYGTRDTLTGAFNSLFGDNSWPHYHWPGGDFWRHTFAEILMINGVATGVVHLHSQNDRGEFYGEPLIYKFEATPDKLSRVQAMHCLLAHATGGHPGLGMKDFVFRNNEVTKTITFSNFQGESEMESAALKAAAIEGFGKAPELPPLKPVVVREELPDETGVERFDVCDAAGER